MKARPSPVKRLFLCPIQLPFLLLPPRSVLPIFEYNINGIRLCFLGSGFSPNMMLGRIICVVKQSNSRTEQSPIAWTNHDLYHCTVDKDLGCFQFMANIKKATINDLLLGKKALISLGYMPLYEDSSHSTNTKCSWGFLFFFKVSHSGVSFHLQFPNGWWWWASCHMHIGHEIFWKCLFKLGSAHLLLGCLSYWLAEKYSGWISPLSQICLTSTSSPSVAHHFALIMFSFNEVLFTQGEITLLPGELFNRSE